MAHKRSPMRPISAAGARGQVYRTIRSWPCRGASLSADRVCVPAGRSTSNVGPGPVSDCHVGRCNRCDDVVLVYLGL